MNYCPNCGKKLKTWLSDYSGWGAYTKCACGKCYEHVCGDWGAPDTDTPCSEKYMKEQLLKVRSYIPEEKLAFYFGTFNPIHNGHLAVMNAVKDFGYTPVLIPSYDSPWKKDLKDSFGLRCAMIAQVTSRFDTLEKDLGTPSYSDQTVWNLRSMYGLSEIPFVIGYDAFAEIDKWQDSEDLKKKCRFLLVPRLIENESEMLEKKADMFL